MSGRRHRRRSRAFGIVRFRRGACHRYRATQNTAARSKPILLPGRLKPSGGYLPRDTCGCCFRSPSAPFRDARSSAPGADQHLVLLAATHTARVGKACRAAAQPRRASAPARGHFQDERGETPIHAHSRRGASQGIRAESPPAAVAGLGIEVLRVQPESAGNEREDSTATPKSAQDP